MSTSAYAGKEDCTLNFVACARNEALFVGGVWLRECLSSTRFNSTIFICSVQAFNSAYRLFMGLSLAGSMVYCNFIIYRTVKQLRTQNKINGGSNEGLQRRMNRALVKIRKVSAFIFLVALVVTYTFANGAIGEGGRLPLQSQASGFACVRTRVL